MARLKASLRSPSSAISGRDLSGGDEAFERHIHGLHPLRLSRLHEARDLKQSSSRIIDAIRSGPAESRGQRCACPSAVFKAAGPRCRPSSPPACPSLRLLVGGKALMMRSTVAGALLV
jgi:hypothetical protein